MSIERQIYMSEIKIGVQFYIFKCSWFNPGCLLIGSDSRPIFSKWNLVVIEEIALGRFDFQKFCPNFAPLVSIILFCIYKDLEEV